MWISQPARKIPVAHLIGPEETGAMLFSVESQYSIRIENLQSEELLENHLSSVYIPENV